NNSAFRSFCLTIIIVIACYSNGFSQFNTSGPLYVGIVPIEIQNASPITGDRLQNDKNNVLSDVIVRTVVDLFPNYLQRGLEKGLQRRVSVSILKSAQPDAFLNAVVTPTITNNGALGVRVTADLMARNQTSTGAVSSRTGQEFLLLSPTENF